MRIFGHDGWDFFAELLADPSKSTISGFARYLTNAKTRPSPVLANLWNELCVKTNSTECSANARDFQTRSMSFVDQDGNGHGSAITINLPPALEPLEAHQIGLLLSKDIFNEGLRDPDDLSLRYFCLERGTSDGTTMVGERHPSGDRSNLGIGPAPGDMAMGKVFERVVSDGAPFEGAHRLSKQIETVDELLARFDRHLDGLRPVLEFSEEVDPERPSIQRLRAKGFLIRGPDSSGSSSDDFSLEAKPVQDGDEPALVHHTGGHAVCESCGSEGQVSQSKPCRSCGGTSVVHPLTYAERQLASAVESVDGPPTTPASVLPGMPKHRTGVSAPRPAGSATGVTSGGQVSRRGAGTAGLLRTPPGRQPDQPGATGTPAGRLSDRDVDLVADLESLSQLLESGALTPAEFTRAKQRILEG
jgi:hypothetical protein